MNDMSIEEGTRGSIVVQVEDCDGERRVEEEEWFRISGGILK